MEKGKNHRGGFRDGLFAPDADKEQRFPQSSTRLVREPVSHDGGSADGRRSSHRKRCIIYIPIYLKAKAEILLINADLK